MMELYNNARIWVLEAGMLVKERMEQTVAVEVKANHSDLVTAVDREVEMFLVDKIKRRYPDHALLGEENIHNSASLTHNVWVIDPIDGTTNFINRKKDFAISLAFCVNERQGEVGVVYDVMRGKLYHARKGHGAFMNDTKLLPMTQNSTLEEELITINTDNLTDERDRKRVEKVAAQARGVRKYGATTIEMCDMAAGRLGGYVQYLIKSWDYAASRIILEELGGKFSDWDGNNIGMFYNGSLVAANASVHGQMLESLKNSQPV